jgi:adenosine kinase
LIYAGGKQITIPTPKPRAIIDPTGCGDAYRAGLLYGIQKGWNWENTGRLASLMGSLKIASRGGQNHSYSRTELAGLYEQHFGHPIKL